MHHGPQQSACMFGIGPESVLDMHTLGVGEMSRGPRKSQGSKRDWSHILLVISWRVSYLSFIESILPVALGSPPSPISTAAGRRLATAVGRSSSMRTRPTTLSVLFLFSLKFAVIGQHGLSLDQNIYKLSLMFSPVNFLCTGTATCKRTIITGMPMGHHKRLDSNQNTVQNTITCWSCPKPQIYQVANKKFLFSNKAKALPFRLIKKMKVIWLINGKPD
jgi:hypothetical protein